jgi:hypothetical protein
MLKRFWFGYWQLVMLSVLIVAVFCMSRYAVHRKQTHTNNTHQSSPTSSIPKNNADQSPQNADKTQDSESWVDTFTWPQGAETWALILTLFVLAWQSIETKHSATSAQTAAKAALRQIDMTFQKERARIDINREGSLEPANVDTEYWTVNGTISVRNVGDTKAFIKDSVGAIFIKEDSTQTLPSLDSGIPIFFIDNVMVIDESSPPETQTIAYTQDGSRSFSGYADKIYEGYFTVHLRGFIEYETLGRTFRRYFGYKWVGGNSPNSLGLALGGLRYGSKDDAGKVRAGYWQQDQEGDNGEYEIV